MRFGKRRSIKFGLCWFSGYKSFGDTKSGTLPLMWHPSTVKSDFNPLAFNDPAISTAMSPPLPIPFCTDEKQLAYIRWSLRNDYRMSFRSRTLSTFAPKGRPSPWPRPPDSYLCRLGRTNRNCISANRHSIVRLAPCDWRPATLFT